MTKIEVTDAHKEVMYNMALNQYRNIKRLKISPGHELFKLEVADGVVSKAKCTIEICHNASNKPFKKFHIEHEVGSIYISALNLNNAHKKFNKILNYVDYLVRNKPVENPEQSALAFIEGDSSKTEVKPENSM